jgi:hypothetical protein
MSKLAQYLLSPNAWVGIFSILALLGLLLCAIGFLSGVRQLMIIGLLLGTPLLIGGIVVLLVVIPLIIVSNWNERGDD